MKLAITSIVFLFTHLISVEAKDLSAYALAEITQKEISAYDKKYQFIKESGFERYNNFLRAYVLPNIEPGKFRDVRLAQYFGALRNSIVGPKITFSQAKDMVDGFTSLSRGDLFFTYKLIMVPYRRSFFNDLAFYSIGIQRALDRLQHEDQSRNEEIEILKDRVTNLTLQHISQFQNGMLEDRWETIFLFLIEAYYSKFDAEVMENLSRQIVRNFDFKGSNDFELRAANNLLLEVTMTCLSRCSTPSFKLSSDMPFNLNTYIKEVAKMCFDHCRSGLGLNPPAFGFNREFILFLKRTNDPEYDQVKSEFVWRETANYLNGSLFSFQQMLIEQPLVYLKQGLGELSYSVFLLLLYLIHYSPAYKTLLSIGIVLLIFIGKGRFKFSKPRFKSNSGYKELIFANIIVLLRWLIRQPEKLIQTFKRNLLNGYGNSPELAYKISIYILVVAITMAVSDLYSKIDSSF